MNAPMLNMSVMNAGVLLNGTQIVNDTRYGCAFEPSPKNLSLIVVNFTIFCLSVVGNSVVLVIITRQRWMRTVTNLYLLNLAISDLLLSVVCMPPTLTGVVLRCFVFPPAFCPLIGFLQPVSVTASAYTLVLIAVERYYAICQPLHSRHWQTKSHALRMLALVWVLSLCVNAPALLLYQAVPVRDSGRYNCRPKEGIPAGMMPAYFVYLTTCLFLLPAFIMLVLYALVISSLREGMHGEKESLLNGTHAHKETTSPRRSIAQRFQRKFSSVMGRIDADEADTNATSSRAQNDDGAPYGGLRSTHAERSLLAKKRVIVMLVSVVVEFFIFWTPLYTLNLSRALGVSTHALVHPLTLTLAYCSTCCNPITYCFLNQKFRHATLIAFGCAAYVARQAAGDATPAPGMTGVRGSSVQALKMYSTQSGTRAYAVRAHADIRRMSAVEECSAPVVSAPVTALLSTNNTNSDMQLVPLARHDTDGLTPETTTK